MTTTERNSVSEDGRLAEVIAAYIQAIEAGATFDRNSIVAMHPELARELEEFFADEDQFDRLISPLRRAVDSPATPWCRGLSSATSPGALEEPSRRFGDYELLEEIARGGMGVVFKARNVRLDRVVALKMILAGHLATAADIHRFRVEAESAAQLDHPNIVPLYDVGEHEGQCYFTMRLIEGGSLAGRVTQFAHDPKAAAALLATVARAVHYAHQRSILHRDLKPANILLDSAGQPHVTDFGLAKRLSAEGHLASSSTSSAMVGTPSYMAPEQTSGSNVLSTAIDIFSLGAILYELLTGRSAFRADTPFETLLQVVQKEPERPSVLNLRVDRDLETICLKCLAKVPETRYGSAEALADDLDRWLAGEPIRARRTSAPERLLMWSRRRPSIAALVIGSALAAITAIAGLAIGFHAVATEKTRTEKALVKYKQALLSEQSAVARMRENSYYQTIALAAPEVQANNVSRADRLLDSCPAELRHWEWGVLKRLAHAESRSLDFPVEPAALEFSRDGHLLAAAGGALDEPGTVALWDVGSGRLIQSFRAGADAVGGLAFDPSGRRLATAGRDHTIGIWDATSGQKMQTLEGHRLAVTCVAFSPDGGKIASGSVDRTVKIWDADRGAQVSTPSGHTASVRAVAFNHDGSLLASSGDDHMIILWDVAAGRTARTLRGHTGLIHDVAFSPDGRILASAAYDGTARIWDAATGRELVTFRGHSRFVTGVSFSPDGRHVASSGLDGTLVVWETGSGEVVRTLRGHSGGVWGVDFHRDGRRIASFGEDRSIKLWDLPALALGAALRASGTPISRVASSGDGSKIAVRRRAPVPSNSEVVEVWDSLGPERIASLPAEHRSRTIFALSGDGSKIARADQEGPDECIRVVTVPDGKEKCSLRRPFFPIASLTLSSDGSRLAIGGRDGGAFLWATATNRQYKLRDERFPGSTTTSPLCILFSHDGTRVVLDGVDDRQPSSQALTVFDAETAEPKLIILGATTPLAFSRDGRRLIALDQAKGGAEAPVFDLADGRELARLRGHTAPILAAAYSPDGARIITSSRDRTLKVWDSAGRELMTLTGNGREPAHLRFSNDGSRLVGLDDAGNVVIWEAGATWSKRAHDPSTANP